MSVCVCVQGFQQSLYNTGYTQRHSRQMERTRDLENSVSLMDNTRSSRMQHSPGSQPSLPHILWMQLNICLHWHRPRCWLWTQNSNRNTCGGDWQTRFSCSGDVICVTFIWPLMCVFAFLVEILTTMTRTHWTTHVRTMKDLLSVQYRKTSKLFWLFVSFVSHSDSLQYQWETTCMTLWMEKKCPHTFFWSTNFPFLSFCRSQFEKMW